MVSFVVDDGVTCRTRKRPETFRDIDEITFGRDLQCSSSVAVVEYDVSRTIDLDHIFKFCVHDYIYSVVLLYNGGMFVF